MLEPVQFNLILMHIIKTEVVNACLVPSFDLKITNKLKGISCTKEQDFMLEKSEK